MLAIFPILAKHMLQRQNVKHKTLPVAKQNREKDKIKESLSKESKPKKTKKTEKTEKSTNKNNHSKELPDNSKDSKDVDCVVDTKENQQEQELEI